MASDEWLVASKGQYSRKRNRERYALRTVIFVVTEAAIYKAHRGEITRLICATLAGALNCSGGRCLSDRRVREDKSGSSISPATSVWAEGVRDAS